MGEQGGATTQADIAIQPARLSTGFESNPLKNVEDDIQVSRRIKKKKKLKSFKTWLDKRKEK